MTCFTQCALVTALYRLIKQNNLPRWVHIVFDEAYSSFGGIVLTPYSRDHLRNLINRNTAEATNEYFWKESGFNHILSSQRITIERAFGILVRRWGILWRPMECSVAKATVRATVCAKLHNICVDR